ncbi:hypothetical protein SEA_DAUDAU_30 [Streptomyces phage Daudau]|uniref:Uncharacterized protein n=1 Tax=Streptomyces phage Daudau TaxID=2041206 RepID=A0A291LHB1_9CAUD|nr:hypothetical protein KGG88_gp30 [Streptomyces phage Daudau]ATI18731.1 hypothetical protein SEA_DAUDAU_30 [Streptomyces phage Daudau]
MEHGLGPDHWRGKGELSSTDGLITLVVDYGDEDYYIDARPGYDSAKMRGILKQARARGLEPMEADECEPELLEDGTVRVYLALAAQPAPAPVEMQEKRRNSAAKRMTLAFALVACMAGALLMPSPLRWDYIHNQSAWKRDHPNHTHWNREEQASYTYDAPEEKGH